MQPAMDFGIASLPAGCHRFQQLQCSRPSRQLEGAYKSSPELESLFLRASALATHELEILHKWLHSEIVGRTHREHEMQGFRPSHTLVESAPSAPLLSQPKHQSSHQLDLTYASSSSLPIAEREWFARQDPMSMPRSQQYGNKIETVDAAHEDSDEYCRIMTPDPWEFEDWCLQEGAPASTALHKRLPANCTGAAMHRATNEPIDAPPAPWPRAQGQLPPRFFHAPSTSEPGVVSCDNSDEVLDWNEDDDTHNEIQSQPVEARTLIQGIEIPDQRLVPVHHRLSTSCRRLSHP